MNLDDAFEEFKHMSPEEQNRRMENVKSEAIDTVCYVMNAIDNSYCETIDDYQCLFDDILNRINLTDIRFFNYLNAKD